MWLPTGIVIGDKYKVVRLLGSGSYGEVYLGISTSTPSEQVALKVEKMLGKKHLLFYERTVYQSLERGAGDRGRIPQLKDYIQDFHYKVNIMVLELLGHSLEHWFHSCSKKFSLKTVLQIGEQMLENLRFIHDYSFTHGDLKPANILMGLEDNSNKLFLIDFGLATQYRDNKTCRHMKYGFGVRCWAGNSMFGSINDHHGVGRSRRDDLEALCYMLIYFLRGSLPWSGVRAANKRQVVEKIMELKLSTPIETLCAGLPVEFAKFLEYTREQLSFAARPNYIYLRRVLFRKLYSKSGFPWDGKLDWMEKEEPQPEPEISVFPSWSSMSS
ncbi:Casein kinase I isoform alpha [Orchesella cincta]|uniref:non-specific serine/threonine protein kinase n=1 Tax=Orchesella cincta TaxID=48709 RepID=A0A1D2MH77_ORCCI|nr:Casein kinase I isoform alpha [Orchesella cincta]